MDNRFKQNQILIKMLPTQTNFSKPALLRQKVVKESRALYRAFRPRLLFWSACARALPDFTLSWFRTQIYRQAGCKIDSCVAIVGRMTLIGQGDIAHRLQIGEGSLIAPNVTFGLDNDIKIGRNVSISPYVTFYTATHALGFGSQRMNLEVIAKPIIVEDGVWVGMHCLIMPGVTLGHGSVVSAGSVVTQDVPPDTLIAGNPAVVQQKLPFGDR
jgi:acetyltransferase-like isoleucine patch superfamily enzyme